MRGSLLDDVHPDHFRSVGFVAQDVAARDADLAKQRYGMGGIVLIAGTEQKCQGIAQAIHQGMNFCGPATPGYPNRLILRFFLAIGALVYLAGC